MLEPVDAQIPQPEIEPIPTPQESIERFFKTMPDDAPERDMIFRIRAKTYFYMKRKDSEDKTKPWAGRIIPKVSEDGVKDPEYLIMMDPEEFRAIYEITDKVRVRNVGRAIGFSPVVENVYYHEQKDQKKEDSKVQKLNIDSTIYVFLNPASMSSVDPKELPAYDPSLDTSNQTVSQG